MESILDSGLSYTFSNGNFANYNKLNFKGDKPYSGTITLTNDKKVIVDNLVSNNKKWCAIKEYDEEEIKVVKANDPEYECIPEDIPIPDKSICELEHKTKWEFKDGVRVKNEYYYIDSPCDLYELSYRVNNGESFSGKIVKLRNNLDMSNIKDITEKLIEKYSTTEFSPIGNNNNRFSGTFDGGAKTIGNLTINKSAEDYIGLFGYIENATIYGLKIKNATIKGKDYVGTVAGKIYRGSAKEIEIESTNVTGH